MNSWYGSVLAVKANFSIILFIWSLGYKILSSMFLLSFDDEFHYLIPGPDEIIAIGKLVHPDAVC